MDVGSTAVERHHGPVENAGGVVGSGLGHSTQMHLFGLFPPSCSIERHRRIRALPYGDALSPAPHLGPVRNGLHARLRRLSRTDYDGQRVHAVCDGRRGHLAGRDGTHVLFGEAGWCWKDSEEAAGSGDDDHHGGGDENCPASNAYGQGGQVEEGDGIAEKVSFHRRLLIYYQIKSNIYQIVRENDVLFYQLFIKVIIIKFLGFFLKFNFNNFCLFNRMVLATPGRPTTGTPRRTPGRFGL